VTFRFTLNTLITYIIYIVGKTGCYTTDKVDRGKQPAMEVSRAPLSKPGGASTSANGGSGLWVSTAPTTTRTSAPDPQTIQPIHVNSVNHSIPVSLPAGPILTLTSNSFSFPLQNAFDSITHDDD